MHFTRLFLIAGLLTAPVIARAQEAPAAGSPAGIIVSGLQEIFKFALPDPGLPPCAVALELAFENATGSAKVLNGRTLSVKFQPPDRYFLRSDIDGPVILSSDSKKLWVHVPEKNLLIEADETVPRFAGRPDSVQKMGPPKIRVPVSAPQLALLPVLADISSTNTAGGITLNVKLKPEPAQSLGIPAFTMTAVMAGDTGWPQSVTLTNGKDTGITICLKDHQITHGGLPDSVWRPEPEADDKVERVAMAHMARFISTALGGIGSRIPSLPPATGERKLVATEGQGRLELHDGTRVLFLNGTPEAMGRQQGVLLKKEIRRVVDRILYGVGVGSSFGKGRWFFDDIAEALRRTGPHVDPRYFREIDALAQAAGLDRDEARMANFFPELFHCSGFALMGKATVDGKMYHGRVLDYLRGAGLEENAVVAIIRPDVGHAWVNVGYAGFLGSVTAMNEKQISIGEMGGGGTGQWDGKPMAQLVREVMEKAGTIDEALEIMRRGPRTCEYYYVLADAKSGKACGLKTTPDIFEVVWTGRTHPQLPEAVPDTVLLSAGERYSELVRRAKAGWGKFDARKSIELMSRPVCMTSNIHSALFCPDTLDFYVANADSDRVAAETRWTKYNLRELLDAKPAAR